VISILLAALSVVIIFALIWFVFAACWQNKYFSSSAAEPFEKRRSKSAIMIRGGGVEST